MTSIINRTQLTDNNVADYGSRVSRFGDVSWTNQFSSTDADVMYQTVSATSATRIGGSSANDEYLLDMSNAGGVVFMDYGSNADLRSYSGLSGDSVVGVETGPSDAFNAAADGFYNVVYEYAFSATDHDIRLFNSATGQTTSVASSTLNQSNPDIAGDYIVYEEQFATGDRDIYRYQISTGQATRIAGSTNDEYNAHVSSNGNVIYQHQFSATDSDIRFYNAATGQTTVLAGSVRNELNPQINGNYATWEAFDGNDWEVFRFDAVSGQTVQVTNNQVDDYNAQVSETGMVAYVHQFSATDSDIYLFDGVSSMGVATSTRNEINPHLNGNYISWEGFDGNDYEVFRAQIAA
jgi:beta propeller repeat protein